MSEKNMPSESETTSGRNRDLYQVDQKRTQEMAVKRADDIRKTGEMSTYAGIAEVTGDETKTLERSEAKADLQKMLIEEFQPGYLAILNDTSLTENTRRSRLIEYNATVKEALDRLVGTTGLTEEDIKAAQQTWKSMTPEVNGGQTSNLEDDSFRDELNKGLRKALEQPEEDSSAA